MPDSPAAKLHPASKRTLLAAAEILRHLSTADMSRSQNDAAELRIAAAVCEGVAARGF